MEERISTGFGTIYSVFSESNRHLSYLHWPFSLLTQNHSAVFFIFTTSVGQEIWQSVSTIQLDVIRLLDICIVI